MANKDLVSLQFPGLNDTYVIPKEIFWATYGTTTSEEIETAYQSQKLVMCEKTRRIYTMTRRTSATRHTFTCQDSLSGVTTIRSFDVVANTWGEETAQTVGEIQTTTTPSVGDFLCYTANGWDAVTVPSASGVSF